MKLQTYLFEIMVAHSVYSVIFYPPEFAVAMFALTLSMIGLIKFLELKESPDLVKIKSDLEDLKNKLERVLLKGGR